MEGKASSDFLRWQLPRPRTTFKNAGLEHFFDT
jgi:hypothetical protein